MTVIIKTDKLSRHYGKGNVMVKALDGVDLEIDSGEFTAIVGPSGSGKTTLLQLIGGLDKPTSGDVYLKGTKVSAMAPGALSDFRRDHIGFIFQAFNLIPVLTAQENVEYIMLLQNRPKAERHEKAMSILESVGLKDMASRRPAEMSGGQQQRVAVARALASEPDIILADEPTANLDSKTGADLIDLMKEFNEKSGVTFVFSTHDTKIMERAKRLVRLVDGRISEDIRQ
ncbi:MAG: ABC transporter ATP-binding protein [Alphaproteobacteria bacterium]|nr:MAG: ABC transporter ATP-binding protein [Alphaproteobacteria bacterium]